MSADPRFATTVGSAEAHFLARIKALEPIERDAPGIFTQVPRGSMLHVCHGLHQINEEAIVKERQIPLQKTGQIVMQAPAK
jgi:hypothetical protein